MAQFTLEWDATQVITNPNATGQRVLYKEVGNSTWLDTGFTPANPLPTTANTVQFPVPEDNIVYEFIVEASCSVNGPTGNDNGPQELISFACITPTITKTDIASTISLDVTDLDITKARLTLRTAANVLVGPAVVANRVGSTISTTKTGLTGSTNYYWQVELYATVQNVEVKSSDQGYLGMACSPYPFTTDAPPVCDPITAVTLTSVEIP